MSPGLPEIKKKKNKINTSPISTLPINVKKQSSNVIKLKHTTVLFNEF